MNLLFITLTLLSVNGMDINDSMKYIYIYDTKIWSEVTVLNRVFIEVDSLDIARIRSILSKTKFKENPYYKPAAISLYGQVEMNSRLIKIRISPDVIFFADTVKKHYLIKEKKDKYWIKDFIERYSLKLEKYKSDIN